MQFIIVFTEHRKLGYIFVPYLVKPDQKAGIFSTYDKLTLPKLQQYQTILSPEQIQLVKFIENYNDQNLHKLFCKKKLTAYDFINTLDNEMSETHIRPYVEKQLIHCIDLLRYNPEPLYFKILQNKIYESDRIELVEQECNTVFNFSRYPEGIKYWLTIEHNDVELVLTGKEGIIMVNEPCVLALGKKLFVFRDIDGKKLTPFFDKQYISIPKQTEKKYFQSFVKTVLARYKVKNEGFSITDDAIEPKPLISLEKNFTGSFSLVLKFLYGSNHIFYANRTSGIKVSCEIDGDEVHFSRMKRATEIENSYIAKLLSYGLVNKEGPFFEPHSRKDSENKVYGPITWLNFNKNLLEKNGFEVVQKDLEKEYYLGNFDLKFEVSEKENDWFDIMAMVEFDGFRIPFIDFRDHITSGIREFVLPNNKIMILPEEWFESYSDILNFSEKNGSDMRLKKQFFAILNNTVSQVSDNFRANLTVLLKSGRGPQEEIPEGINAQLRNYQQEGYTWMYNLYKNSFGGCLADDMGLGKTLQTLILLKRIIGQNHHELAKSNERTDVQLNLFELQANSSYKNDGKTSLIIAPTSLIHNWLNEIQKFAPLLRAVGYTGSSRGKLSDSTENTDIIITSYGILRNDLDQFLKESFLYLVLDESQMIKNPGSKTYTSVIQLNADHRLVLSGTPIENSLSDLWAQFNFINPGLLGNFNFFQSEFQYPIEKHGDESKRDRLRQLIAPFILRRTKKEVAKELPDLSEQIIYCEMNEVQENYYEREKSKARNLVLENINRVGLGKATIQILQSLMRLRQIANHPLLVDNEYLSGSGKFDEISMNIENLYKEGHKALIFSSFVSHLEIVGDWLRSKKIKFSMLTGETRKREEVIHTFQHDEDCPFFLVSLKAGGVGLNLTAASYVLMLDPWWNPAAEKQAVNRAHRIGQDKNVMVYRFIARNTLEEKIIKLQERKSQLADIFVNENPFKNITEEEILELFE